MKRGKLRVLLGAAPGVGKTFTMLEEGHRMQAEAATWWSPSSRPTSVPPPPPWSTGSRSSAPDRRAPRGVPRRHGPRRRRRQGPRRRPGRRARAHERPGSQNEKRWQDVEALLAAGISVISTVNIQHMQSLGDVVREITGTVQRETVPDAVVRAADQIEVVDLAPASLRERLSDGLVYPAARIDAALSKLLPARQPHRPARDRPALARRRGRRRAEGLPRRARHRPPLGDPRARARRPDRRPEGETLLRRGARIAARARR